MISYASLYEDVLLWRALAPRVHHDVGFWIDAGAYDPEIASVTKTFYDHGWHGINIEPMQYQFDKLVEQRPRDINLQLLISDHDGSETFYHFDNGELSTSNLEFAQRHLDSGMKASERHLRTSTLTSICEQYAPEQIHFLKIDIEGHEAKAIRGMDFNRFRPWILVMESTEPNTLDRTTYHEWEGMVSAAGYQHVYSHLPNRFYVANEHPDLKPCFSVPVDEYHLHHQLRRISDLEREVESLKRQLQTT